MKDSKQYHEGAEIEKVVVTVRGESQRVLFSRWSCSGPVAQGTRISTVTVVEACLWRGGDLLTCEAAEIKLLLPDSSSEIGIAISSWDFLLKALT